MSREPYQAMLDLLLADLSPQEAEQIIRPLLHWTWEAPVRLPATAPVLIEHFRDLIAWRRFEADNPVSKQLVCVHLLYRAAGALGVEENDAALTMLALAREGVREVLIGWLRERTCPHCVELRGKLETAQVRNR